ncbi:MAG TPA: TonB-dependent receptor, partial [Erythrobacter sp.]|nr:TonB-dependent receptor [Erythrobacter sp.]
SGDRLPDLPRHALVLNAGVGKDIWRINATASYLSDAFGIGGAEQSTDPFNQIESRWLVDLSAEADVIDGVSVFASAENVFDKTYNVSIVPAGLRPGMPRTLLAGVRIGF